MAAPTITVLPVDGPSVNVSQLPIIPEVNPTRRRTLVLCFDGTGDQFDADNSNVIQLFTLLQKDNRNEQMVYYQAGIGTYTVPQIATPFYSKVSKALDAAIAWNLDAHLMDGYTFLMQNYQAGDKICIFGFSRGAYTARSLAGMVHKIGLLPACNHQQVPFAYKMYTRTDKTGWEQSKAFKKAFSVNVDIEFVGVWDTVCSVGLIPKRLPFVSSNTAIRYFRHAVSLDEHRAKFKANLYNRPTDDEDKLGVQPGEMPVPEAAPAPVSLDLNTLGTDAIQRIKTWMASNGNGKTKSRSSADEEESENDMNEMTYAELGPDGKKKETDVLEVWFAGCHCDVGGGSVDNDTPHNLARIPLRWMIRQCFEANTGIRFHTDLLRKVGLDPAALYPVVKPRPQELYASPERIQTLLTASAAQRKAQEQRPILSAVPASTVLDTKSQSQPPTPLSASKIIAPSLHERQDSTRTLVNMPTPSTLTPPTVTSPVLTEEEEDLLDALCPIYDQLELAWGWWTLEVIPLVQRWQRDDKEWVEELTVNMGRPRHVPKPNPEAGTPFRVHRSVKVRMEAGKGGMVEVLGWDGKTPERKGAYEPRAKLREEVEWVA